MFRLAFDPALPLVASSAFGDVAAGDVFDWRARGIAEIDALALFRSGLLTHAVSAPSPTHAGLAEVDPMDALHAATEELAPELLSDAPGDSKLVELTVTPGPSISVETPAQRDQRRKKR